MMSDVKKIDKPVWLWVGFLCIVLAFVHGISNQISFSQADKFIILFLGGANLFCWHLIGELKYKLGQIKKGDDNGFITKS